MAIYYFDPAATGAADGSNWTNAFTDLVVAWTSCLTYDTIYFRGTYTPTTYQNIGSRQIGISIIGCNSSGVDDGTLAVINCVNISTWGSSNTAIELGSYLSFYSYLKNIEIKNSSKSAIDCASLYPFNLYNCYIHDCQRFAIGEVAGYAYVNLTNCTITDCALGVIVNTYATYRQRMTSVNMCMFTRNGNSSTCVILASAFPGGMFYGNLIYNNIGIIYLGVDSTMVNCTIDGNIGNGITVNPSIVCLFGNRITNNIGYGINITETSTLFEGGNFINGNSMGAIYYPSEYELVSEGGTAFEGNQGYVNRAAGIYNLTTTATNRDIQIDIDGINKHSFCSGFIPEADKIILSTKSRLYKPAGNWRMKI